MSKSAAQIIVDPDWIAYRYSSSADQFHFRHVMRAQRAEATFLTDQYLGDATEVIGISRQDAMSIAPKAAPLHFIFHSAFCCSTLLAHAFDIPGVSTTLKEPMIFNDLIGALHRRELAGSGFAERLNVGLRLLARPHQAGEVVIIKPSNVSNGLIMAMLGLLPNAHAVLLHAPLATYLKSIAKKGIDGRLWVRDLLVKHLTEGLVDLGLEGDDYLRLTDLQAAAVGWLVQQALFAKIAERHGARIRTLNSEDLMANPAGAVSALAAHFGLAVDDVVVNEIASGPAFTRHSKTGAEFGAAARTAEYDEALAAHRDEIEKVLVWAKVVADGAYVPMDLPSPLLP